MKLISLSIFFSFATLLASGQTMNPKSHSIHPPVKLGVEVLFENRLDLIRGKHVGLITNPTGLDGKLDSIIDRFRAQPDTKLVALYGPEHGVRGNAQAGEYVAFYFDEHFKLPVFSLYGQTHKPPADMMTNIDEYMRTFDTQHEGKKVEAGMMQSVDVMVFDLQDVGTRVYTYIATMANAMEAAANASVSKAANTSSTGLPQTPSSRGRNCSNGTGGTWLCRRSNSSIQGGGNTSTRVASTWPSLTKVGPNSVSARRIRTGRSSWLISLLVCQCNKRPARSSKRASPIRRTISPQP